MINGISRLNNGIKFQAMPKSLNIRHIDVKNLMKSTALKTTLLYWQMTNDQNGITWFKEALSFDMPFLAGIKYNFCRMDDNTLLKEAHEMLKTFIGANPVFQGLEPAVALMKFVEIKDYPFCMDQFFSTPLMYSRALQIVEKDAIIESFRKILIFTAALEVLSKMRDFTPLIKEILRQDFPQLEKEIAPADYLSALEAEDIYKTLSLLKHINEKMKIDFDKVNINTAIAPPDTVATINGRTVIIYLLTLLKFKPPFDESINNFIG